MAINPTEHEINFLARLLKPLGDCLTPEVAEKIANLRADPEVQARIDQLAEKCTEGELTVEEQAEYDCYVQAIDFIAVLQAQAREVLETNGAA
jgi:predicted transcriptional regulator